MRCKIVRFQKFMWRNMMKLTKSQKVSVLHYSIDDSFYNTNTLFVSIVSLNWYIKWPLGY